MGSMTVEEIYKDRKKFSKQVFEVASSDLVNMGITVVSYTLKDIRDEEVSDANTSYHDFEMNEDTFFYNITKKFCFKNIYIPSLFSLYIFDHTLNFYTANNMSKSPGF